MSSPDLQFEYTHLPWGEIIRGSKSELQSLGIAVDMAFPGELGGPARKMTVRDPRGFKTSVERWYKEGYSALISLPGREREPEQWADFAPGVRICRSGYCDTYVGTADALAHAGLARVDQFPGQPGARKVTVTIFADGTVPCGPPTAYNKRANEVGAKQIMRASKHTFCIRVKVDEATATPRLEKERLADKEYAARMRALPRPAPLTCGKPMPERVVKGHLSLVWSAKAAHSKFDGFRL